jgi:SAM-dependent methyltransferase
VSVTGERVSTSESGFNPTWQRHVAAYRLCAPFLPPGRVLDMGCGVGHSFSELAPRESVGLDLSAEALRGQERETVVGDMRALPFADGSFDSVLSVHSVEHVSDHAAVLRGVVRVLVPDGVAVFVTPNRLTFARPDEIIDPYHEREYSPRELREVCERWFGSVEIQGIFGSPAYLAIVERELAKLDRLLRRDPLRLRRLAPRRLLQVLYDRRLQSERSGSDPEAEAIDVSDFFLGTEDVDRCLDVVAVCRDPRAAA